jgi:Calcineurin-like phosphoesterase
MANYRGSCYDMRIVALSDQHGFLPEVPPCDLLIVAGDVCPDRFGPFLAMHAPEQQKSWFDRHVRPWLASVPAAHKILTWGNHDWCGQACNFRRDSPAEASLADAQILVDEGTVVPARESTDRTISVWATPWSNQFMNWAFMKQPSELDAVYGEIPDGTDILVSHQPPYGYGDRHFDVGSGRVEHLGSRELLAAVDRIRPKLVICGHIHDGHGRTDYAGVPIYNVSVVDEQYRITHPPTVIDLPE